MGRILAVDDEIDMLSLLKMIVESYSDHQVTVVNNPLEAVELLQQEAFDIVLTDLKMPGIDGIELLEKVQKIRPNTLVIVITAFGSLESAEEATRKGAFDYITKPFRKEQILMTINKALDKRQELKAGL
jgi:DNA-binding NtrC family response regulator